ncbi:MAG TPA: hypothetical protein VOA87_13185 [Thermoanaerobaculia bacterium]|nr:hypothetical protein [Thermoanaerobaculia bacterium]
MRSRTPALFLLLALSWGTVAAIQPCAAMGVDGASVARGASSGGCAGHAAHRSMSPAGRKGCCDPSGSERGSRRHRSQVCEKACQAVAVLGSRPVLPGSSLSAEVAASPVERPTPLLILAIDHVPLA